MRRGARWPPSRECRSGRRLARGRFRARRSKNSAANGERRGRLLALFDEGRAGSATRECSRSCSSCSSRRSGQISRRTVSMAAWSRRPAPSATLSGRARRRLTARVRRSSRPASSRNAYGLALMSSWANCEGTGVSTARQRIVPDCDAAQHFVQAFEVHCFLQDVLHHFVDQRMVGNLDVADDGLEAGGGLRKDAGQQVFGARALDLRRNALALRHAQQLQRAVRRPSASAS